MTHGRHFDSNCACTRSVLLTVFGFFFDYRRLRAMPACCAWGCSNRHEKGHTMYRFPRDPARRKVWTNRVSRKNWTPTLYSYLCDVRRTLCTSMYENDVKKNVLANVLGLLECCSYTQSIDCVHRVQEYN